MRIASVLCICSLLPCVRGAHLHVYILPFWSRLDSRPAGAIWQSANQRCAREIQGQATKSLVFSTCKAELHICTRDVAIQFASQIRQVGKSYRCIQYKLQTKVIRHVLPTPSSRQRRATAKHNEATITYNHEK